MTSRPSPSSSDFRAWGVGLILAMVTGYAVWDAVARSRHVLEVTAKYGVTVDAPALAPASPTGYADGRRSLVLPAGAADTAHWIMQTQAMVAAGEWRVRHVDYDNAPDGREVHWAMPLHGWLAGLAWVDHVVSGRPPGVSVERATLYAGPVMFILLLAGMTWLLIRKFSGLAAVVVAVGLVAVYPFYIDFMPARADHHGLANICAALTGLFLLVGSAPAAGQAARRWFIASALAGGAGLWISAATQAPVLLGVGVGVLAGAWFGRGAWPRDPDLFRLWGRVGAGASLLAWLFEYFPAHLGMRLEVNHPLYAAAWLGAGETLRVLLLARRDGLPALSRRDRLLGGVGAALVALLPLVIAFTAARTFTVADPFVWRLHVLYISEFQGLSRSLAASGLTAGWLVLCLPALWLLPALGLALRRTTPPEARALIALALVPALLGWGMGWVQVRWLGLAFALSIPVIALCCRILESTASRARWTGPVWAAAGLLVFLPGLGKAVQRTRSAGEFSPEEIRSLAERDVAHWLRLRAGGERVVVAATPTPTTRLIALGGLNGLGTLYWENATGLKQAAALLAAPTPEAARALAARAGVTHIVLFSWDAFEVSLGKLARGLPDDQPFPPDLFVAQLLAAPVPPAWLRPVAFPLPSHPALQGAQVRIWEVTADQSPAAATAHAAAYYLELGRPEIAARFAPLLAGFKDDLVAAVLLGGITSRQGDQAGFAAALARVRTQLPQAAALALDDHIALVVVLAVAEQLGPARDQLQRAMARVDERSLRRLSPGALADLLALTDGLGAGWPDPALRTLAISLLPPGKRP